MGSILLKILLCALAIGISIGLSWGFRKIFFFPYGWMTWLLEKISYPIRALYNTVTEWMIPSLSNRLENKYSRRFLFGLAGVALICGTIILLLNHQKAEPGLVFWGDFLLTMPPYNILFLLSEGLKGFFSLENMISLFMVNALVGCIMRFGSKLELHFLTRTILGIIFVFFGSCFGFLMDPIMNFFDKAIPVINSSLWIQIPAYLIGIYLGTIMVLMILIEFSHVIAYGLPCFGIFLSFVVLGLDGESLFTLIVVFIVAVASTIYTNHKAEENDGILL